jgi:hypothetical protein
MVFKQNPTHCAPAIKAERTEKYNCRLPNSGLSSAPVSGSHPVDLAGLGPDEEETVGSAGESQLGKIRIKTEDQQTPPLSSRKAGTHSSAARNLQAMAMLY